MLQLADLGETDEGSVLFKKVGMMEIKIFFLIDGMEIKMKNGNTLGFCLLIDSNSDSYLSFTLPLGLIAFGERRGMNPFLPKKTHWTLVNVCCIVFVIILKSLEIIGCGDGGITVFVFQLEQSDI